MSVYQSTLPRRTRPVEERDFKVFPNIRIDGVPHDRNVGFSNLHWWNAHIPIEPADMHGIFCRNFADDIAVKVELGAGGFTVYVDSVEDKKFDGSAEFLFGKARYMGEAKSKFKIQSPQYRGHGIGKSWLKSLIELSVAVGHPDFRFDAGSENGAYSWASMGVEMDMSPAVAAKRAFQSYRTIARVDALKDFLSVTDYKIARSFCEFKSKNDPANLAKFDVSLPDDLAAELIMGGSEIYESMDRFFRKNPSQWNDMTTSAYDERTSMHKAFVMASRQKKETTLPRCILSWTLWPAAIDFDNGTLMEKLGTRLGGWDSIRPL